MGMGSLQFFISRARGTENPIAKWSFTKDPNRQKGFF